jgi:hypothetical protein
MDEIIKKLKKASLSEIIENKLSEFNHFIFKKNINPKRLYLYLHARFGKPNGMLSKFRKEDSDNMFHWHYTLKFEDTLVHIMCATYRLEIFLPKIITENEDECLELINNLIQDIKNYSIELKEVKKDVENWEQIINPFNKIKNQISKIFDDIDNLSVEIESIRSEDLDNRTIDADMFSKWANLIDDYSMKCFLIRCLIPIYLETFINLILHVCSKKEIKENKEEFDSIIRKKINERVLEINNCIGIQKEISIHDIEWQKVQTIFNNRNDLLHGNINIDKLKFNDVSFIKNMPLFNDFSDFKNELLLNSYVKFSDIIENEIEIAERFIYYILFSFEIEIAKEIKRMLINSSLGYNKKTKRFGILFSDYMVDYTTDLNSLKNLEIKEI